ncbi:hypothetical protein QUF70_15110 [Desulfobacterales bacterium HSG17]|nr:hypothetical protein [Desulfobacterales bacterium HSG17]
MIDTDFDEYAGYHGTTIERWLSIKEKNTFDLGEGERGTGAYFWENNIYARSLAVAWYVTAKRRGEYSKDKNQSCAIVWAKIRVNENDIIDLAASEYRSYLYELLKMADYSDSREEAHKLYDELYDRVEDILGRKIKLVIATVHPPSSKGVKVYPTQTIGMAPCYIVRDSACIIDLSCEEIEDFNVSNIEETKKILEKIKNET